MTISRTTYLRCDGGTDPGKLCTTTNDCGRMCVGGTQQGSPCSPPATSCTVGGGTCPAIVCEPEQFLVLNLVTKTIGRLNIQTESGTGTSLHLRFWSKNSGGDTLTAENVTVDGVNGPVTVRISEVNTALVSDPTD